jgi:hypothetical protein
MTTRKPRSSIALASLAFAISFACSSPSPDARFDETVPDQPSFAPVGAMLIQACGSLDCHGMNSRNLRLYGDTALRLSATDVPSTLIPTTKAEIAQDYDSVVGLEPELMSQVVASGGANPERLTLIQKARGAEDHKGGAVVAPGDSRDSCMTSWLAGKTDVASCTAALSLP